MELKFRLLRLFILLVVFIWKFYIKRQDQRQVLLICTNFIHLTVSLVIIKTTVLGVSNCCLALFIKCIKEQNLEKKNLHWSSKCCIKDIFSFNIVNPLNFIKVKWIISRNRAIEPGLEECCKFFFQGQCSTLIIFTYPSHS